MCNELAHMIQSNMDVEANPCDDFYKFSCGKFMKEAKVNLQLGQTSWWTDSMLTSTNVCLLLT